MAYKALATPEAGADPTGTALVSPDGNGKRLKLSEAISSGDPIWLISAPRSGATEAFVPLGLAPGEAEILAVGRHPVFPIFAVALGPQ